MHHPNLGRLALPVARPIGGNADGKRSAKEAPLSAHNEFPYDLITTVLTSLDRNDREGACRAAARWCRLNKAHRQACKEDPSVWRRLMQTLFPTRPPIPDGADAEAEFFNACSQWQEMRMQTTRQLKYYNSHVSPSSRRFQIHVNVLDFRDDRERELSALVKRAEALHRKSESPLYRRAIGQHLKDLLEDAINRVYLARDPRSSYGGSWEGNPTLLANQTARLSEAVRIMQARVDARTRALWPQTAPLDVASAPHPTQPDSSEAGPSDASGFSSDEEVAYDSEDEPATPPGFDA